MTTTAGRRLAKLEGSLRPREAVLAWLAEVQELTDIDDYSRHVAEVSVDDAPMSVIGRRIQAAVRDDMKGKPRDAVVEAVRRAFGDALFLFCLVFQVNIEAVQRANIEGLRAAAAFFWMGSLLGGPRDEEIAPDELAEHHAELTECWASWLSVVERLAWDVQVVERVRATLADRYYAGQDVLFADARTGWAVHVKQVERIHAVAHDIGSTRHGKAARKLVARRPARPTIEVGVEELLAWLIGQARVRAFEVLGERPKAVAIMEAWLLRDRQQASDGRAL